MIIYNVKHILFVFFLLLSFSSKTILANVNNYTYSAPHGWKLLENKNINQASSQIYQDTYGNLIHLTINSFKTPNEKSEAIKRLND